MIDQGSNHVGRGMLGVATVGRMAGTPGLSKRIRGKTSLPPTKSPSEGPKSKGLLTL